MSITKPKTKKELRQILGLLRYGRLWIEGYTQAVKFSYDKLTEEEVTWTKEDEGRFEKLKQKLITAPALSLPALEKPFYLFVNIDNGVAHGVLTQDWGRSKKPIAYLSKLLDPVSRGWPTCIQAVATPSLLVEESRKLTFGGKLKVYTPHSMRSILNQKAEKWLTGFRILKYEAILIDRNDLELVTDKHLNPAQFLYGEAVEELEHNCLDIIDYQTKVREDLTDQPLQGGEILYINGSSRCMQGRWKSGCAIINGQKMTVAEKGKLPPNWLAQACELYALVQALKLIGHGRGTIYTDSKYAFGVVHTFGKIWEERGLLNSKRKGLIHEGLILEVLKALRSPEEIAGVHIKGHQRGMAPEIRRNNLADREAKDAAENGKEKVMIVLTSKDKESEAPRFSKQEEERLKEIGAEIDDAGNWKLPDKR